MEVKKEDLLISDDKSKLNKEKIYYMLNNSYWASTRTIESINTSIDCSICFGLYKNKEMIGFARGLSDKAVSSWLYDLIIDKNYRGNGLGKWFFENIIKHPDLVNTKIYLTTRDAHGLYSKYGFERKEAMLKESN